MTKASCMGSVALSSIPKGSITLTRKHANMHFVCLFKLCALCWLYYLYTLFLSGKFLSGNNCVLLGHTKYKGMQLIYCNPFPAKPFHGCHRQDLVIIRPPGIDNGAFVVKPDTVWYARVLLLFSTSVTTDTGAKAFDCALVSTLETYDDPENGYYWN